MQNTNLNFRLLMEYHSFLFKEFDNTLAVELSFPSPYGVSFILILWLKKSFFAIFF